MISYLTEKFEGFTGEISTESIMSGMKEYMDNFFGDFTMDFNMSDYLNYDKWMSDFQEAMDNYSLTNGFELGVTPVITDDSEITNWQNSLGKSSLGGTVAGYTSEDVRNLTAEIYHLEDALYSLKEAMKNQQVVHSGELTLRYANSDDLVDKVQTAIIGSIRREVRG